MKITGLTDQEVAQSRQKHGDNRLTEQKSEGFFKKLLANLGDPMIRILVVALLINVVLTFMGHTEWYEPVGIAVAVILATTVSTVSEYSNENSFQKLQEEASKIVCKVYRNGQMIEIPIDDVVVGDCVMLQAGDKIPADGVLLDGWVSVDQSVLNGESEEAKKTAIPAGYEDGQEAMDFLNPYKVFRGTTVYAGNGVMRVSVVGDQSVYGKIAAELQEEDDRESPLKVKLGKLASDISKFGYIGGILIAIALMVMRIVAAGSLSAYAAGGIGVVTDLVDAVILAVIIIVMAVPEGLPLMIAIVSAQNMGKMLKDNVLVREINGIETAGSLNILFSDKTGTITKGQLEVVSFTGGAGLEYGKFEHVPAPLSEMLALGILHNTTAYASQEQGVRRIIGGNGTDRAVLGFVPADVPLFAVEKVAEIPFNSTNKYAATQVAGTHEYTLIKGAPEKILNRCKWYFDENGQKQPFDNQQLIEDKINEMAQRAIRVLGVAVGEDSIDGDGLPEGELTLVGVLGIRDEVRQESALAIREVQNAGVQVVMITGDRKDTAIAIARESGLLQADTDIVLTSDELLALSDEEVKARMKDLRVVSRALPSDKSRLVRLAQELNLVVGMTGDGVNDSPALKRADIGFGMGSGTEVAKEASDIVILDDNFSSIDRAILYGRTIFNSIRKFIVFQLTINVTAVLVSFFSPLLGMENPLTITQILWVNLVMDTFAALAFGGEPALKRYMKEAPKRRDEPIVNREMWTQILSSSIWIFALSMVILLSRWASGFFRTGPAELPNMYLLTGYFSFFIFAAVFNGFNARTEKMNLFDHIGENKGFLRIMALIAVVQVILTYVGGSILRGHGLLVSEWVFVLLMAITVIPIDLIRKAILSKRKRS